MLLLHANVEARPVLRERVREELHQHLRVLELVVLGEQLDLAEERGAPIRASRAHAEGEGRVRLIGPRHPVLQRSVGDALGIARALHREPLHDVRDDALAELGGELGGGQGASPVEAPTRWGRARAWGRMRLPKSGDGRTSPALLGYQPCITRRRGAGIRTRVLLRR